MVWNKGLKTGLVPKSAFKKGHVPWSKLVAGTGLKKAWNKGKKNPERTGSKHFAWRGEAVSYRNLHRWVERLRGKAFFCEDCGLSAVPEGKKRFFQWANLSGEYLRILEDWRQLCYTCHKQFDMANRKVNAQ